MTIRQRLNALLGFQPDANGAEASLIDAGVEDDKAEYTAEDYPKVRSAAIRLIETLLSTPDSGNQMTGFWTKYDRGAIEKRLAKLQSEAGIITGPTIRAVNRW